MAARPKRNRRVPWRLKDAASVSEVAEAVISPRRAAAKEMKGKVGKKGKPPLKEDDELLSSLPPSTESQGEAFIIDRILDVEADKAYVSFKGWDASHNEWLPFTHLSEKVSQPRASPPSPLSFLFLFCKVPARVYRGLTHGTSRPTFGCSSAPDTGKARGRFSHALARTPKR